MLYFLMFYFFISILLFLTVLQICINKFFLSKVNITDKIPQVFYTKIFSGFLTFIECRFDWWKKPTILPYNRSRSWYIVRSEKISLRKSKSSPPHHFFTTLLAYARKKNCKTLRLKAIDEKRAKSLILC